jgi:predicted MPP superfamily phosphohydrolase
VLPLFAFAVLAGLACVLYGVLIEHSWYRLRTYRLAILPTGSRSALTVLHLSDLHFVHDDARKARFLAGLPRADVTIVTGDFLAEPAAVEAAVAACDPVRGRLASWFVLGSNDYYVPRPLNYFAYFKGPRMRPHAVRGRAGDLIAQLQARGWTDLTNDRRDVDLNGVPVELLGLDDAHIKAQDYRVAPRSEPERFGLAVMHSPDSAPEAAALGYELIVAGHTHGGQVCFPLVGALVTNCAMPRRIVKGLARMGDAVLHTSPGLGTSKFAPFRFWCRPEATILELVPRPARPGA